MLQIGQTLDMSPIGMTFYVIKTGRETNQQCLELLWTLQPKAGGAPVHTHPTAKEIYKVLEGVLEVNVNGKWNLLKAGDEFLVEEGVAHTFRNPSEKISKIHNTYTPALRFEEYFEGLHAVVDKLAGQDKKAPLKVDMNVVTHLCMLMKKHKDEIRSVDPPPFMVSFLTLVGKLRRLKV